MNLDAELNRLKNIGEKHVKKNENGTWSLPPDEAQKVTEHLNRLAAKHGYENVLLCLSREPEDEIK